MAGVITEVASAIARFPSWWLGELGALLPKGLRRAFREKPKWVVVDISGPELVITRGVGKRNREVGRVDSGLDGGRQRKAIHRLVRKLDLRAATLVLRLPETNVLRKPVDLPLAAEENLREVLSFEMDRQTPFKPGEFYFDHRIVRRDPETQRLQVELTVIPRSVVEVALEKAAGWGVTPDVVDVAGNTGAEIGALNLLPPERAQARGGAGGGFSFVLGLVAVLLMTAVIYELIERESAVASIMEERVAAAKVEAEAVAALGEELERLVEEGRFLRRRKRDTPSATVALEELTRVLPDHTWVYELNLNDGDVRLAGFSAAASDTIALIEASPLFSEVAFRSPVTQDARSGLERFNLSAKLVIAGGAE